MLDIVKARELLDVTTINTNDERVIAYKAVDKLGDVIKGQILADIKVGCEEDGVSWYKRLEELGVDESRANSLVAFSRVKSGSAPRFELPETADKYRRLKGDTPEEKSEEWQTIKEEVGNSTPSQRDIQRHNRSQKHMDAQTDKAIEALETTYEVLGWGETEKSQMKYMTNPMTYALEVTSTVESLCPQADEWKTLYRQLSKEYHPDMTGDATIQTLLSAMNNLVQISVKVAKQKELSIVYNTKYKEVVANA